MTKLYCTTTEKMPTREWLIGFINGYYQNGRKYWTLVEKNKFIKIIKESRENLWELYKEIEETK